MDATPHRVILEVDTIDRGYLPPQLNFAFGLEGVAVPSRGRVTNEESMQRLADLVEGAVLVGFRPYKTLKAIRRACKAYGVGWPTPSDVVDLRAFLCFVWTERDGLPDETPLKAVSRCAEALRMLGEIREAKRVHERWQEMPSDEQRVLGLLWDRLDQGRSTYGAWNLTDGRRYPREALEEVLDGLHYCAAALVNLAREEGSR
jgi:hypothetical protein